ncbi:MAG: hypothetical protein NTU44_06310 [Bacteroidetes bacterium]|nr:hypothetical protein [Bacteroidota bacterium]
MDTPLNAKQRNAAIIRFVIMTVLSLALVVYHYVVTMNLYNKV